MSNNKTTALTALLPTTIMRTGTDFIGLTNYGTGHATYINYSLITKFTPYEIKDENGVVVGGYTDIHLADGSNVRVNEMLDAIDNAIVNAKKATK